MKKANDLINEVVGVGGGGNVRIGGGCIRSHSIKEGDVILLVGCVVFLLWDLYLLIHIHSSN